MFNFLSYFDETICLRDQICMPSSFTIFYSCTVIVQETSEKSAGSRQGSPFPKAYKPNIIPVKAPPTEGLSIRSLAFTLQIDVLSLPVMREYTSASARMQRCHDADSGRQETF